MSLVQLWLPIGTTFGGGESQSHSVRTTLDARRRGIDRYRIVRLSGTGFSDTVAGMSNGGQPYVGLVTGAQGVIGRNVFTHLQSLPEWRVRGVARRPPLDNCGEQLAVDLLDPHAAKDGLAAAADTTHLIFAAYQERKDPYESIAANVALLRNTLDALEAAGAPLAHVTMYQGGKAYGAHLGPYKTPAKESDPRLLGPNFYYDQEDLLRERSARDGWRFTILRPDAMLGIALGNPMNLLLAIAVYATITRELHLPLRFPGTRASAAALTQATDAELLARATAWAATSPAAADEIFNVTNGDQYRWEHVFPMFAHDFEMPYAGISPMSLTEHMSDKGTVWHAIIERHGLRPTSYRDIASWPFADGQFNTAFDLVQNTVKIRQAGFHDCVDSETRYRELFAQLRRDQYIPALDGLP
jgi:nucleoside-diphosphate-sugar epimerase